MLSVSKLSNKKSKMSAGSKMSRLVKGLLFCAACSNPLHVAADNHHHDQGCHHEGCNHEKHKDDKHEHHGNNHQGNGHHNGR